MAHCPQCGFPQQEYGRFCSRCGAAQGMATAPWPAAGMRPSAPQGWPAAPQWSEPPAGRAHSPALALVFGLVIPGAGQAYNGKPIRGFFLFFASVLVLPYLLSLYGAYTGAVAIAAQGGRMGRGGLFWVFLQAWLAFNTCLLVLIVLTIMGKLT